MQKEIIRRFNLAIFSFVLIVTVFSFFHITYAYPAKVNFIEMSKSTNTIELSHSQIGFSYYLLTTNGRRCTISVDENKDVLCNLPNNLISMLGQEFFSNNILDTSSCFNDDESSELSNVGIVLIKINDDTSISISNCASILTLNDDTYSYSDDSNVMVLDVLNNDNLPSGIGTIISAYKLDENNKFDGFVRIKNNKLYYHKEFKNRKIKYFVFANVDGISYLASAYVDVTYKQGDCRDKISTNCNEPTELRDTIRNVCNIEDNGKNYYHLKAPEHMSCDVDVSIQHNPSQDNLVVSLSDKKCDNFVELGGNGDGSTVTYQIHGVNSDKWLHVKPDSNYDISVHYKNCEPVQVGCVRSNHYVSLTYGSNQQDTEIIYDKCVGNQNLLKFSCNDEGNGIKQEIIKCKFGCVTDNAEQGEEFGQCMEINNGCYDSDSGNDNYTIPGYVIDGNKLKKYDDDCDEDGNLIEQKCNGNNDVTSETKDCSELNSDGNNYVCRKIYESAACVSEDQSNHISLDKFNKLKLALERTIPSYPVFMYLKGNDNYDFSINNIKDYFIYSGMIFSSDMINNLDSGEDPIFKYDKGYLPLPEMEDDYAICPRDCHEDTCTEEYIATHKSTDYCVYNHVCYQDGAFINRGGVKVKCEVN